MMIGQVIGICVCYGVSIVGSGYKGGVYMTLSFFIWYVYTCVCMTITICQGDIMKAILIAVVCVYVSITMLVLVPKVHHAKGLMQQHTVTMNDVIGR